MIKTIQQATIQLSVWTSTSPNIGGCTVALLTSCVCLSHHLIPNCYSCLHHLPNFQALSYSTGFLSCFDLGGRSAGILTDRAVTDPPQQDAHFLITSTMALATTDVVGYRKLMQRSQSSQVEEVYWDTCYWVLSQSKHFMPRVICFLFNYRTMSIDICFLRLWEGFNWTIAKMLDFASISSNKNLKSLDYMGLNGFNELNI